MVIVRHPSHSTSCCEHSTDSKWTSTQLGSDENDDATHTPKDCKKVNYSHNEAL